MPGPPAKHPDARRRRNKKATATTLTSPESSKGPALPDGYVIGVLPQQGPVTQKFSKVTRRWWDKIRTAPQAGAYQDVHWEWLLSLAPLFDRWVALGDLEALKELRLQAPAFGLRPSDANKLDWTIDPSITGPAPRPREDADEEPPPRSGRGSGTEAWRTYATDTLGLTVPDGASRADIIAMVDARVAGRPARRDPRMTVYDGGAATAS